MFVLCYFNKTAYSSLVFSLEGHIDVLLKEKFNIYIFFNSALRMQECSIIFKDLY